MTAIPARPSQLLLAIALNDLARHNAPLRAELDAAIARVQDRGWYILGPEVEAFESEFAAYCGARECVAVGNGTDALELALRSLAIGPGDEVATAANAGMYATTAIRAAGATPAYVEIDASTLLMDPAALRVGLTPRTRAMIVTHLYGRVADVDALAGVARESGIALIEDCAQAHGAQGGGGKAGTAGVLGCFSFYPTKNLGALGDAGAVVTSDPELAAKLRALRTYGWGAKYHCTMAGGMNSRMDELQAAVLRVKLPHLDAWNRRRRAIAARYADAIAHPAITLPPAAAAGTDVVHLYVVRVRHRESMRAHLAAAGVATDVHYPVPDHLQPGAGTTPAQGLARTERACAEVLSLPCYPELSDAEIAEVAAACNQWQPDIRS
jgi:aminotransferase EvaB